MYLVVFAVLLLLRGLLPIGVGLWVNHVLAGMKHYRGEVGEVRLNLWRGSYEIDQLRLYLREGNTLEPLVEMRRLDFSVQWKGLWRGRVVAEATCFHPVVYFAVMPKPPGPPPAPEAGKPQKPPAEKQEKTGKDEPWSLHLDELAPFELNRFVIRDGEIRYRDLTTNPTVDLYMTDFYLEALNIANVRDKPEEEVLLAEIEAAGRPFGTGEFEARMRFDPFAEPLRMELDASVRNVQLIDLNDFFRAFGSIDAEGGTLGIYAEFATSDGVIEGYVKTLFDRMRILRFREIAGPADAIEALWEGLLALAIEVFENQPYNRLATRVPLRGTSANTTADVAETILGLLRNAFLAALGPAIDDSVDLAGMEIAVPRAGAHGKPADVPPARENEERAKTGGRK